MVSTKYVGATYKPWKPVSRPVSKSDITRQNFNGPPSVAPKPGGKVFVYVYEAPEGGAPDQSGYGALPPNAKLVIGGTPPVTASGSTAPFLYSSECVDGSDAARRLRNRLKESEKGYKVLADVSHRFPRNSSRGGRMFIKQRKRMDNFTSPESSGQMTEESDDMPQRSKSCMGDEKYTPWNMAKSSHAAAEYIPSSLLYNNKLNKPRKGELLPRLRSPPPLWRAKVESDFSLNNDSQTLPNRRWNTVDTVHRSHSSRSVSAPPPIQMYFGEATPSRDDDIYYADDFNGERANSRVGGIAAVNFDARTHKVAPHRKQGVRTGRGIFTTIPHAQLDFNARAVGWGKAFAEQY